MLRLKSPSCVDNVKGRVSSIHIRQPPVFIAIKDLKIKC